MGCSSWKLLFHWEIVGPSSDPEGSGMTHCSITETVRWMVMSNLSNRFLPVCAVKTSSEI